MDPNQSPELVALFEKELDESASLLVDAGLDLEAGRFDRATLDDVIRTAHTVKGSASLMGHDAINRAAEQLESAWKLVQEDESCATADFARSMVEMAASMRVVESPEVIDDIGVAIGTGSADEDPVSRSLGGLLSSAASALLEGTTRVETGALYRLINHLVEVSLDASAISDLALVTLDGADQRRVMKAWRIQLERFAGSVEAAKDQAVALADESIHEATDTFPQFIRYLGRRLTKEARLEIHGANVQVDGQIVDRLREPLRQLLVNAVDHGIESASARVARGKAPVGTVSIAASTDDDHLVVTVTDDGGGIDWEAVARASGTDANPDDDLSPLLLQPGFTTRATADDFSGTGEGLAVVADVVESMNGGLRIDAVRGKGTSVTLTLPKSLVIQNMVVVALADQFWGVPEAAVMGSVALSDPAIEFRSDGAALRFKGQTVPLVSLAQVLGVNVADEDEEVLIVMGRSGTVGVTVPEIVERRRVAVKGLGPILGGTRHISAAAFLGGGEVLVVVDPAELAESAGKIDEEPTDRPRVLVVDDSAGVRQLISVSLAGSGFDVTVASGAVDAIDLLRDDSFDALVVDFSMPRQSGVELVQMLRARGLELPVIMVSGVADEADKASAWDAGVDAYVDKFDVRHGVLVATLNRLLEEGTGTAL